MTGTINNSQPSKPFIPSHAVPAALVKVEPVRSMEQFRALMANRQTLKPAILKGEKIYVN